MKFRLPSPSFVLALVALFVALGGGWWNADPTSTARP